MKTARLPVEFGGVSIGQSTARLGIRISREDIEIDEADNIFCGRRLKGKIELGKKDEDSRQTKFFDSGPVVEGVFDVKRIGLSPEQVSTGLTFSIKDVDIRTLAKFSKGVGVLSVESVEDLPEEADEKVSAAQKDAKSYKAEGPWRDVPMDSLFSGSILASFHGAGIETMGQYSDWANSSINKRKELKGIGEAKQAKIDDVMAKFWEANPQN